MKKKNIVLSALSALAVLSLASCATTAVENASVKFEAAEKPSTDVPAAYDYGVTDTTDLDVYINYDGESGVSFRGTSWNNSVDGYTYTQGSVLPTWTRLGELTKTNVREACGYMSSSDDNAYTSVSTAGYKSEVDSNQNIDLFYNSTDNLKKAGNAGNLIDLKPYIDAEDGSANDLLPNLKAYLKANPAIEEAITVNGHIYYAPYLDGNNDVENTFVMDTSMVETLLDSADDSGDDTKGIIDKAEYQPFITEAYTVTVGDGSGTKTITVDPSTNNIITLQNALINQEGGCTGKELLNQLKDYIKEKYSYSKLSELYTGYDAAYNVDELVALMRVVKSNPQLLTGDANADIEVFIPRGETASAIESVYDLAQLWGVQGVDGENGNYYYAADGSLNCLETSYESYQALQYVSQLYDEGLILKNFYVASATKTSTRYLEQYYKRTMTTNTYAFMMYDDATVVTAANDMSEGIGTAESSRVNKDDSTTGIRSVLPPFTYWTTDGNSAKEGLTATKTITRYYESSRSLQTTSWSIPATSDNIEGALRMIDVMYTDLGSLVQNYGPEAYWQTGESGVAKVSTELVTGETNAIVSQATKVELVASQNDFWSFMRGYVGATHGIGYVRKSGLNLQATNKYGQIGTTNLNNAIKAGIVQHATSDSTVKWCKSVPVSFSTSVVDNNAEWDGLTGFWAEDKVNKNEGWVNVVVSPAATSEESYKAYVIKTAKNAKRITYSDMINEESVMDSKCLFIYANSLGALPSYLKPTTETE